AGAGARGVEVAPVTRILVESDGRADVRLADIVRGILARRGMDMTDMIYQNTLRVTHHG
ncbi:hypothetical protein HDR63_02230, partial [bacterium]|nr:hypothetical protein [bacterium]